jgi:predicted DCC family thiol-disulfide oxidoreductase YuxK
MLLLYDGECPMCQRARDWIAARAAPGAIELMPCQDPARPDRAPQVSDAACMEAMQLVADGRVYAGERAVPRILDATPGYRWLGALMRIPGVLLFARPVYALIARNRLAISALFIKRAPGERCTIDKDCG